MKRESKSLKGNNKGFSLVELIVVMAIMAILVGAVAISVVRYVERARVSRDEQVLNTVFIAVQTTIASTEATPVFINDTYTAYLALPAYSTTDDLLSVDMDDMDGIEGRFVSTLGTAAANDVYVFYDPVTGFLAVYSADNAAVTPGATSDTQRAAVIAAIGTTGLGPVTN